MTTYSRRHILAAAVGTAVASTANIADASGNQNLPINPFRPGEIVVFQGDSITDGGRQREGLDYNHIMGQDYCYIIAGEILSHFPNAGLTFLNRGIGGNTVVDLASRWQTDTIDLKPSLLSILIGVNDAGHTLGKVSPEDAGLAFRATYDSLLQQTIAALPGARIILGQPFVLPVGDRIANYSNWRAQVAAMQFHSESLADNYKLPYVRYGDIMDELCKIAAADHWSWDGIHPTYAGHFVMHSEWLKTLTNFKWPK